MLLKIKAKKVRKTKINSDNNKTFDKSFPRKYILETLMLTEIYYSFDYQQ